MLPVCADVRIACRRLAHVHSESQWCCDSRGLTSRRLSSSPRLPAGRTLFYRQRATGGEDVAHRASSSGAPRPSSRCASCLRSFLCKEQGRAQLSGPAVQPSPAGARASRASRSSRRLSQQGFGAVRRHVLSVFDHVKGRRCQCGSRSRQTGAMVLRLGMPVAYRPEGCLHRAPTADDDRV